MKKILRDQEVKELENSFSAQNTRELNLTAKVGISRAIPDYFQRVKVFGVLPVDDSSGDLRTGICLLSENGDTVWLNLLCADAEWLAVTFRSWMKDYLDDQENNSGAFNENNLETIDEKCD